MALTRTEFVARYRVVGGMHSVHLPKELREHLGLVSGDFIVIFVEGDVCVMRKVTREIMLRDVKLPIQVLQGRNVRLGE